MAPQQQSRKNQDPRTLKKHCNIRKHIITNSYVRHTHAHAYHRTQSQHSSKNNIATNNSSSTPTDVNTSLQIPESPIPESPISNPQPPNPAVIDRLMGIAGWEQSAVDRPEGTVHGRTSVVGRLGAVGSRCESVGLN